jgi:hypothetical protein
VQTKIFLIPLFRELSLSTDGTSNPVYYDINSEKFRAALPYAVSLTLYSLTEGEPATNDVEWNVVFRSGFDRNHETTDINKLNAAANQINANGSLRSAAFTDISKFLLESRLQVSAQNKAGVSGLRTITTSAVLAVETIGM